MSTLHRAILALALTAAVATAQAQPRVHGELLVAAAASLSGVLPDVARAFHARHRYDVRFNFAGSNTLARQIVEGARVDVFISADETQMDVVEHGGRLVPGTRVNVIGNQLVIAVGGGVALGGPEDLTAPAVRRIAMGDPEAVPAGVYGRRWLEHVRVWNSIAAKVVPLPSSPAALQAVRAGRADAAIVYVTDVRGRDGVRVAHMASPHDAPTIVYPAAAIAGGRALPAREFVAFLLSAEARRIFEAAGFTVAPGR